MISYFLRSIVIILAVLYVLRADYLAHDVHHRPYDLSNQRSAESNFKYAWFTRDIHDQLDSNEDYNQYGFARLQLLRKLFRQK
jgi:hypothetical protein